MTHDAIYDATAARRATGLLGAFNRAGVLSAADVHVASRVGALGGETDEQVLLAAALTVRAARHGSVVLDLAAAREHADNPHPDDGDDDVGERIGADPAAALDWPEPGPWAAACEASPIVATGDGPRKPLRMHGGAVWLDRYWQQETQVADELLRRSARPVDDGDLTALAGSLARLYPGETPDDQRLAAAVCALSRVSVLAGGPGTGKTTTVARLLAVLHDQPRPPVRVALAAPTGKAAARLEEAVRGATARLGDADQAHLGDLQAMTLHRLLGRRPGMSSRFRHDAENRLPHDVVVVDESSMMSLTMIARLLDALRPDARLVLVGDPHQLASVEAGAVLGDLVDGGAVLRRTPAMWDALRAAAPADVPADVPAAEEGPAARVRDGVAVLSRVYRYDEGGAIGELAAAVVAGHADDAVAVLRSGDPSVELADVPEGAGPSGALLEALRDDVVGAAEAVLAAARAGDPEGALAALDRHRLLCAHRTGGRGVRHWSALTATWLAAGNDLDERPDGRFVGQPLLVRANDYEAGLYNGDAGVVVAGDDGPVAAFGRGGAPILVPLARLGDVQPLYAMTVHRSQGSQFGAVTFMLPPAGSLLGTRETLYTAVTRAVEKVRVVGSEEAFVAAVERRARRATGLRRRIEQTP